MTDPYGRILGFIDRSHYFFYQVAPPLYSRGWVDPVPDPLLFFSGSAGNRTRASGSVDLNNTHYINLLEMVNALYARKSLSVQKIFDMMIVILWAVRLCSMEDRNKHFAGRGFMLSYSLHSPTWGSYVPMKWRLTCSSLHSITVMKTTSFLRFEAPKVSKSIEECRLLGCGTVWVYYKPTFRRNVSPPSSG
jgi:hypothetical protein